MGRAPLRQAHRLAQVAPPSDDHSRPHHSRGSPYLIEQDHAPPEPGTAPFQQETASAATRRGLSQPCRSSATAKSPRWDALALAANQRPPTRARSARVAAWHWGVGVSSSARIILAQPGSRWSIVPLFDIARRYPARCWENVPDGIVKGRRSSSCVFIPRGHTRR